MTIIRIDPISTTSLLSATSTTESTVDNKEDAATTAVIACSTLTTPTGYAHADTAQRYIDSLSDTQLIELETRLAAKEDSLGINIDGVEKTVETPKTYKKI